jgi:serine protease
MNKKLLAILLSATIATPIASAEAANTVKNKTVQPSIAILDTAIDTSVSSLKNRNVYEVCILAWNSCPNGTQFQEGKGAATLPLNLITKNGFDHGTQMASAAANANPNMGIVFVRIVGNTLDGRRQLVPENSIANALSWVIANKDRLNIQAVAMSQGNSNYNKTGDYCPASGPLTQVVNSATSSGLPVFFPAGNDRNYTRINWPACIPSSIAVGGTDNTGAIAIWSNYDANLLDFYSLGQTRVEVPGNKIINAAGTSIAAQIAASNWIALKSSKPHLSYSDLYSLIIKTSSNVTNSKVSGKLFNLGAALNG